MKRFTSLISRSRSHDKTTTTRELANVPADSPEANAPRAIRSFCESGANSNGGEEVLHLPVIVEAAESSPAASAASARTIQELLGKQWSTKPHVQFNAIMVLRILSDHPGPSFTKHFDKSFVSAVKELLRNCRDQSTQQILRETLDSLEVNKAHDEGLQPLIQMWRKEKGGTASLNHQRGMRAPQAQYQQPYDQAGGAYQQQQQHYGQPAYTNGSQQYGNPQQSTSRRQLPPPFELASRVEEARNTANILLQLIQSTPHSEIPANELIKEFNERCQSASKSMQNYISADNPPPDDNTLQTLIETNEQLSLASSRYQRAVLAARRAVGTGPSPGAESAPGGNGGYMGASAPESQPQSLFQSAPTQSQDHAYPVAGSLFGQSHYQNVSQTNGYSSPPGPPPGQLQAQQRASQQPSPNVSPPMQYSQPAQPARQGPRTVPFSDPFADPFEHENNPAPLAFEPTNYGSQRYSNVPQHTQPRPHEANGLGRRGTLDLENAYSPNPSERNSSIPSTVSALSPTVGAGNTSPTQRPGPGAWHNSTITPSFLGRQTSAADGLTMHGAQSDDNVAELDHHSQVGRREREPTSPTSANRSAGGNSFQVSSPVDGNTPLTERRVDVAGTGGFRNSFIAKK
ncbi:hypothetical protein LTR78_009097 [Recurvomyces mirabilis]|uniref:GAT domain-containing protein n=1 Tax=Recurvomyces mirabilis TaxID=574656 RepID=A0AAE0TTZ2_9PEZI|nr:hypothetical protein LTR78_009097 [Recurvomyces mirabilis]KAK5161035.1 hypothetical protein LTS14_000829 [Recurvomyces mirabilis]